MNEPTANGPPEPIELPRVRAFLTRLLGPGVEEPAPLGAGAWSQAYSFRLAGADYVLRIGNHGEDYAKDRRMAAFSSPDLPIPEVLEVGQALDRHYAISRRAFGEMLDHLDADGMRCVGPAVFRALDAARSVDLAWSTGYGPWSADGEAPYATWEEYLLAVRADPPTSRCHGWRARLAAAPFGEGPFEEAFAALGRLVSACPPSRHLLHTDLLNRNVLVTGDRISAVFDWGNALFGDFLYELAMFTLYAPWFPSMRGIDWGAGARRHYAALGLDVPHFSERLRCCELHIGLTDMAYNAFTGNWDQLRWIARRTLDLARDSSVS